MEAWMDGAGCLGQTSGAVQRRPETRPSWTLSRAYPPGPRAFTATFRSDARRGATHALATCTLGVQMAGRADGRVARARAWHAGMDRLTRAAIVGLRYAIACRTVCAVWRPPCHRQPVEPCLQEPSQGRTSYHDLLVSKHEVPKIQGHSLTTQNVFGLVHERAGWHMPVLSYIAIASAKSACRSCSWACLPSVLEFTACVCPLAPRR